MADIVLTLEEIVILRMIARKAQAMFACIDPWPDGEDASERAVELKTLLEWWTEEWPTNSSPSV